MCLERRSRALASLEISSSPSQSSRTRHTHTYTYTHANTHVCSTASLDCSTSAMSGRRWVPRRTLGGVSFCSLGFLFSCAGCIFLLLFVVVPVVVAVVAGWFVGAVLMQPSLQMGCTVFLFYRPQPVSVRESCGLIARLHATPVCASWCGKGGKTRGGKQQHTPSTHAR